jgi:hypothetical protein
MMMMMTLASGVVLAHHVCACLPTATQSPARQPKHKKQLQNDASTKQQAITAKDFHWPTGCHTSLAPTRRWPVARVRATANAACLMKLQ